MAVRLPQALPHLEGGRGAIVRALYLAIAVPTLALVVLSIWFAALDGIHNFPATTSLGFRTLTPAGGQGAHIIDGISPEAARAGVLRGDRIVAVDGVPLPRNASEFQVGERLGALKGDRARLALITPQGKLHEVTLRRDPAPWSRMDRLSGVPLWLYALISTAVSATFPVVMLAASLLLFLRRPREPEAMLFAFVLAMLALRPGMLFWWQGNPLSPQAQQLWWKSGWMLAFVAIAGFPDGRFVSRIARLAVVAMLAVIAVSIVLTASGGPPAPWLLTLLNLVVIGSGVASGVSVVVRFRRTPPGSERQQIKWAVGGFCITLAGLSLATVLESASGGLRGNPVYFLVMQSLQIAVMLGLPLGLLVSQLRYRLYDAEAAMSRSALYAVLTLSLVAIFAGSQEMIETMGEQYFGGSLGALAGGIAASFAAVMLVPLHNWLSGWTERRFQRALIRLRTGLPLLVADLRETASPEAIAQSVLKRVEAGVRGVHGAVIVDGAAIASADIGDDALARWQQAWQPREAEGLDCVPSDPVFPLRVPLEADGCGRIGWLLLGPRPDGSFYGKDERAVLAEIADPIARALAIARQREAEQGAMQARLNAIESRFGAIEKAIGLGKRRPATAG